MFKHYLYTVKKSSLYSPMPSAISYMWNFGSLLLACLMIQISSGFFLASHFVAGEESFEKAFMIMRDAQFGWLLRLVHLNMASFFFFFIYLHISRGFYFFSYKSANIWWVGGLTLVCLMGSAFLGYVLPWGQMSFWGATVITGVFTSFPLGVPLMEWLWGGYAVGLPTLTRFFAFHYILPFILAVFVIFHIMVLHNSGSSNPLGLDKRFEKLSFYPFFVYKDLNTLIFMVLIFLSVVTLTPWVFGDPENFFSNDPLATPKHIQPEWYFLFAYAILRCVPSKVGGVVGLIMAVAMLFILPLLGGSKFGNCSYFPICKGWVWCFFFCFLMLTYLGAMSVSPPYLLASQVFSCLYFVFFCSFGVVYDFSRSMLDYWE